MAKQVRIVDLGRLAPAFGEGRRLELPVRPGALTYGGGEYEPAGRDVSARLDVSRTASGYALRMRFATVVTGPCVRCLERADVRVEVDVREIDQPGGGEEELSSPYVEEDELDVGHWAHDALALALPHQVLCRPDCAGLCPVCGASLNDVDPAEHRHEAGRDPRWAKLDELR